MSYIGPFKKTRLFILFICSVDILLASLTPFLIGELINIINNGEAVALIMKQGLITILVALFSGILNTYQNYKWHLFSVEYLNYFRTLLLKAGLNKDTSFYKNKNEDYATRILQDSLNIAEDISIGLPMLILNVLRLAIVIFFMVRMNAKLSLIPLTVIPIYIVVFHFINKDIREKSKKEREGYSLISKTVNEYLSGIFEIKINNKEEFFLDKFRNKIKEYTNILKRMRLLRAISYGFSTIITGALPVITLVVGGIMVYKGNLEIGFLFSFYAYLDFLYEPMNNLIDWYTNINVSLGMADRILDFLDYEIRSEEGIKVNSIEKIQVKDLDFSYGDKEVLKNISFDLNKGDILAIVGESGSGKSTLANLLLKNIDFKAGSIFVNGIDLHDIDKKSYYDNLSLISQDVFIFTDTLRDNISYGGRLDKKSHIFKEARLEKLINSRKSLESLVSNDELSGGEKQRLAIARVLYKNSDLIVLDEFTAALDQENEKEIVDTFMNMNNKDKIYIIISHRKYPLSMANKILDLNDGGFRELI
ncbi:ABC transporter ATP-binding protein [Anaerococcus tetradius]|uniref:ABC transporter ATP-binding protein n=1 Tax=Anaerococcus tetradius TaxID=33036 RepID=UPI0023F04B3E|nr:ABC transporter ATP-binding protein [Anaerococcus tetradius]